MNLRISDPKIEELAQELANRTGEDPTAAVIRALEERLERQPPPASEAPLDEAAKRADRERREAEILKIVEHIKSLPVLDDRTPEEMLYDEDGLPK
jgi:antitoxin VapB